MGVLRIFLYTITLSLLVSRHASTDPANANINPGSFLKQFGYMNAFADERDVETFQRAIKGYQIFNSLPVTGKLDPPTLEVMAQPRCGLPDPPVLVEDDDTDRSPRIRRFNVMSSKWSRKNLTWKILNFSPDLEPVLIHRTIKTSLSMWQAVSGLTFTESSSNSADILFSFGRRVHGDPFPFDGPGGVLAHGFYPTNGAATDGDVHFDDDEYFGVEDAKKVDLLWVTVHELGHSLGIDHSNIQGSLMYPVYRGYRPNFSMHQDDIAAVQTLYGPPTPTHTTTITTSTNSPTPSIPTTLPPTTKTTQAPTTTTTTRPPTTTTTQVPTTTTTTRPPTTTTTTPTTRPPTTTTTQAPTTTTTTRPPTTTTTTTTTRPPTTTTTQATTTTMTTRPPTMTTTQATTTRPPTTTTTTVPPHITKTTRRPSPPTTLTTAAPVTSRIKSNIDLIQRCPRYVDFVLTSNGKSYVFEGSFVWVKDSEGIRIGPYRLDQIWKQLTGPIDAAYTRPTNGEVLFFQGKRVLVYKNQELVSKTELRNIGFPNVPKIDAVFNWGLNNRTYIFSGSQYWRYSENTRRIDQDYPQTTSSRWIGLPNDITAALEEDDQLYFFKGADFYKMDISNPFQPRAEQNRPVPIIPHLVGCNNDESRSVGAVSSDRQRRPAQPYGRRNL